MVGEFLVLKISILFHLIYTDFKNEKQIPLRGLGFLNHLFLHTMRQPFILIVYYIHSSTLFLKVIIDLRYEIAKTLPTPPPENNRRRRIPAANKWVAHLTRNENNNLIKVLTFQTNLNKKIKKKTSVNSRKSDNS